MQFRYAYTFQYVTFQYVTFCVFIIACYLLCVIMCIYYVTFLNETRVSVLCHSVGEGRTNLF